MGGRSIFDEWYEDLMIWATGFGDRRLRRAALVLAAPLAALLVLAEAVASGCDILVAACEDFAREWRV